MSQQKEDGPLVAGTGPVAASEPAGQPDPGTPRHASPPSRRQRPWARETLVAAAFVIAGVVATWPRAAYLAGRVPAGNDQGEYVWNMWWVAHQVTHLGNPWFTSYLAAPVGVRLGYDTLTPLPALVLTPVTLLFGPTASFTVLAVVTPGLAGYAMYRLARLWLPGLAGPLAAGAFFGLSGMQTFQVWAHVHTAAGVVFLPLAMEAAVRLRRGASARRGVILGLVLGVAILVDQEFAALAVLLVVLLLVPWLFRQHGRDQLRAVGWGALTALVIATPQLIAMAQQAAAGGSRAPVAGEYLLYSAQLPALFAPSPRLADYGAAGLAHIYQTRAGAEGLATFGVVLTVVALLGLVVSWRRRSGKLLGLLWVGSAVLALGPTLYLSHRHYVPLAEEWRGIRVSLLMPYTWLIRLPGLSSFREPDRLAFLGLVSAALLAGAAVTWLRQHARPLLIAVVAFGALEAGWAHPTTDQTMPATLPAVDRPIAADHSGSIVVDAPFGIIGVPDIVGTDPSPMALVLATADGHPRAVSYTSWTVAQTLAGIRRHAFYDGLVTAQMGQPVTAAEVAAARQDLRSLHVGWVLVWQLRWMEKLSTPRHPHLDYHYSDIYRFLAETGFHVDHQATGVVVYRP